MPEHPHRVHEETSNHWVLNKVVYVWKTSRASARVAEPVLIHSYNVAVDVTACEREVLPDSNEEEEASGEV